MRWPVQHLLWQVLKKNETAKALYHHEFVKDDLECYHLYFYSATYFPRDSFLIRSALPYNNDLTKSLQADQHYIWFALCAILLLTVIQKNLSDSEFGVEDIGKQIGLSRVQLYRKVKAMTGSSVVDLLRKAVSWKSPTHTVKVFTMSKR